MARKPSSISLMVETMSLISLSFCWMMRLRESVFWAIFTSSAFGPFCPQATSIMAPMAKTIIFFIILVFCLITYFILYISVLLSCGLACQDYDKLATWVVLLKMGNDFCQSATH